MIVLPSVLRVIEPPVDENDSVAVTVGGRCSTLSDVSDSVVEPVVAGSVEGGVDGVVAGGGPVTGLVERAVLGAALPVDGAGVSLLIASPLGPTAVSSVMAGGVALSGGLAVGVAGVTAPVGSGVVVVMVVVVRGGAVVLVAFVVGVFTTMTRS